jgi:hypothetical protein
LIVKKPPTGNSWRLFAFVREILHQMHMRYGHLRGRTLAA